MVEHGDRIRQLKDELAKIIIGQHDLLDGLLIGLLAGGHVLVEGRPGMAKTLAVKSLAACLGGRFSRIQFTPDLLPSDIVGHQWYDAQRGSLEVQVGPIMANLVLADEINRAPAKVQSALLEVMEEHQVTVGGNTFAMPEPFLVVATENPLEQQGTYALPEAQKDRFLLKIRLDYLTRNEEAQMLTRLCDERCLPELKTVLSGEEVLNMRQQVQSVHVDARLLEYALDLVIGTRPGEKGKLSPLQADFAYDTKTMVEYGVSPRGVLGLVRTAKARAFLQNRDYVLPGDLQAMAVPVLAHRLMPSFEAEARGVTDVEVVNGIVEAMQAP